MQVQPLGLQRVLDQVNVETAKLGWRNALRGQGSGRKPGAKAQTRQSVALLAHHASDRKDSVGDLARQLLREFPGHTVIQPVTLEPIDLATALE